MTSSDEGSTTRAEVLRELHASHHIVYYQLISIVQGSAFAYLIASTAPDWGTFGAPEWMLFVSTFAFIVVVWNGYIRAITQAAWPWTLVDAVIPFLAGTAQVILVRGIGDPSMWYWGLCALAGVGLLAYLNMEINSRSKSSHVAFLPQVKEHCRIHQISCLLVALLSGTIAACGRLSPLVVAILSLFIVVAYIAKDEIVWVRFIGYLRADESETISKRPGDAT